MCRWLAYRGGPQRPSALVLDSPHSLVAQSRDSRLGAETVNGDGFGLGWYDADGGVDRRPAVFRSIEPAWNDQNLREIADAVSSPLFFSHVRAAAGPPVQQTNCHPFRFQRWLFMHNGEIAGFDRLRRDLALAVDPALYPHLQGTTDSEVLFHLALTAGLDDDPVRALEVAVGQVEATGRVHGVGEPFQGTIAVTDGASIWAVRYSSEGRSRTLFHSVDVADLERLDPGEEFLKGCGDDAFVVVSEPLVDLPGAFLEVPEATVAVIDADGYHHRPFRPVAG